MLLECIDLSHDAPEAKIENTLSADSLNRYIAQPEAGGVTVDY
jgi:hypothetical protein